jgi:hypothetical protein
MTRTLCVFWTLRNKQALLVDHCRIYEEDFVVFILCFFKERSQEILQYRITILGGDYDRDRWRAKVPTDMGVWRLFHVNGRGIPAAQEMFLNDLVTIRTGRIGCWFLMNQHIWNMHWPGSLFADTKEQFTFLIKKRKTLIQFPGLFADSIDAYYSARQVIDRKEQFRRVGGRLKNGYV